METLTYTTETLTTNQAIAAGAIAGGLIGSIFFISLIFYILTIIAGWKIFEKAGEKGWKALIPIYNVYILYKIVNMKIWFWLMLFTCILISIVTSVDQTSNVFIMNENEIAVIDWSSHIPTLVALAISAIIAIWAEILYAWRTSKAFGHGVGYFLGLLFLQPIFWLILGFDKSKYDKKYLKSIKD